MNSTFRPMNITFRFVNSTFRFVNSLQEWAALRDSKSGERGIFNRAAAEAAVAKSGRRDPNHEWGCNPCR